MGPRVVPRISPFDLGRLQLVSLGSHHLFLAGCWPGVLVLWLGNWPSGWISVAAELGDWYPPSLDWAWCCDSIWGSYGRAQPEICPVPA